MFSDGDSGDVVLLHDGFVGETAKEMPKVLI